MLKEIVVWSGVIINMLAIYFDVIYVDFGFLISNVITIATLNFSGGVNE